jgi:hypothetical protein
MALTPSDYGPAFEELLVGLPLNELGPGEANEEARPRLQRISESDPFEPRKIADDEMAACCVAAVWLLHNFLDESHRISQSITNREGSFWHGIMHRREPDYSNAKYWFRKVGDHPVYSSLSAEAAKIVTESPAGEAADFLNERGDWNPIEFIDLCQKSAEEGSDSAMFCRLLQQREWELLFEYCFGSAIGQ